MKQNITDISVLIVTRGACPLLESTLRSLKAFKYIYICHTPNGEAHIRNLAECYDCSYSEFSWGGQYPKKRQWCLNHLNLTNDWVLMIDADEQMTPELEAELRNLQRKYDLTRYGGFFIRGHYVLDKKVMKYGFSNNKLCLMHRERMRYPVVEDIEAKGMGEIEGHYQPVLVGHKFKTGQLKNPILHIINDSDEWLDKHDNYAEWEAFMVTRRLHPKDPVPVRNLLKNFARLFPFSPQLVFLHSYFLRQGFRHGKQGLVWSKMRYHYRKTVRRKTYQNRLKNRNLK